MRAVPALAIASIALLGFSAPAPAGAAVDSGPSATISVDCADGQHLYVTAENPTGATVAFDIAIDSQGDAGPDIADEGQVAPGAEFRFDFSDSVDGEYHVVVRADGRVIADEQVSVECDGLGYFLIPYDGTIWVVDHKGQWPLTFAEWEALGFPRPHPVPTDYVKYTWSDAVSAVSYLSTDPGRWVWKHLSYDEWAGAGHPTPRIAGWIAGSTYYQWQTSPQLIAQDVSGVRHALTYDEWAASGFRAFEFKANQGFVKLSWDGSIAFLNNVAAGVGGGPISYAQWLAEGRPEPAVSARFPGDQVYRDGDSATVYYAGPTVNRAITYAEWTEMGQPEPTLRTPARPADTMDCSFFRTRADAQLTYNYWYPLYGDVYKLDPDNNGMACEELPR